MTDTEYEELEIRWQIGHAEGVAEILRMEFPGVPIGAVEVLDALASHGIHLEPGRMAGVAYQRLTIGGDE